MAKKAGYRSRSAYKLLQLDNKYRLLKAGDVVIDFGASPGGWLQASSSKVGKDGFALGIDLKSIEPIAENTRVLVGDIFAPETLEAILKVLPRKADVVLSDLAPDVTGVWQLDHLRQIDLTSKAVDLMSDLLRQGGSAVLKVFEGEATTQLHRRVKEVFGQVFIAKPPASRGQSSEIYFVALDYRAP